MTGDKVIVMQSQNATRFAMPTIEQKRALSEQLARDVEEWLAKGNQITVLEPPTPAPPTVSSPATSLTQRQRNKLMRVAD